MLPRAFMCILTKPHHCLHQINAQATNKRMARLTRLWNAHWYGNLYLKKPSSAGDSGRKWTWESVFVVVQGHRIVWWRDERQFDEAETPIGHILLSGHAGLAGLSPLDLRELRNDEAERTVNVFGRGCGGQQKVGFLTMDCNEKSLLEGAIIKAAEDDKIQ